MVAIVTPGEYFTNSGLLLKFGTVGSIPNTFGDYLMYGPNRIIEGVINLPTVATTTTILGDQTFFPALPAGQLFIEKVEAVAEIAALGGTTFSVGLIQMDRSTIPGGYATALINAAPIAGYTTAGNAITYIGGTAAAGSLIGSSAASATGPYYITALTTGVFTTGSIRIRIYYHAMGGSITQ